MLLIPQLYNIAGTMTCRPVLIHVLLISIIFEHYKELIKYATKKIKTTLLIASIAFVIARVVKLAD
jgi:hypothetical protein